MKKMKVAIAGAGPSGMTAAEVLRSNKFRDKYEVTIYEKHSEVGGKCRSVTLEDGRVYEVGAVALGKRIGGWPQVHRLVQRYKIDFRPFIEKGRPLSLSFNEKSQRRSLGAWFAYMHDFLRYSRKHRIDYHKAPRALNKTAGQLYAPAVNNRLSHIVQGMGYAEFSDPHLAPPLLYCHQYMQVGMVTHPLQAVTDGTQSIWQAMAATYSPQNLRLNQPIMTLQRSNGGINITTEQGTEAYDYLIVTTPLSDAVHFLDVNSQQKAFLSSMRYSHYITVLCEAEGLTANCTFNTAACTDNDQIGRVLTAYKRYPDSNTVCLYLFLDGKTTLSDQAVIAQAAQSLKEDMQATLLNPAKAQVFHWPDYFPHLDTQQLDDGWYQQFEAEFQNKDRTLYLSSGLHMETINASVEYATAKTTEAAEGWLTSALA